MLKPGSESRRVVRKAISHGSLVGRSCEVAIRAGWSALMILGLEIGKEWEEYVCTRLHTGWKKIRHSFICTHVGAQALTHLVCSLSYVSVCVCLCVLACVLREVSCTY